MKTTKTIPIHIGGMGYIPPTDEKFNGKAIPEKAMLTDDQTADARRPARCPNPKCRSRAVGMNADLTATYCPACTQSFAWGTY